MRHTVLKLTTPWIPPMRLFHAGFALIALFAGRTVAQDDLRVYYEGGTPVEQIS